jgi:hypothetical protein
MPTPTPSPTNAIERLKTDVALEVRKGVDLALSHGPLRRGKGMVSGMIALVLANFSMLAVLMLQFPAFLSTPKVREVLSFDAMRGVLLAAMVLCGALALTNIAFNRVRRLSAWALFWLAVAVVGSQLGVSATGQGWLPVGRLPANMPYLGVDWFIFDLLATTLLFTTIEKLRPLRADMPVFRKQWQTDFMYFVTGHLLVGLTLFLVYAVLYGATGMFAGVHPVAQDSLRGWFRNLPFGWALLLLMLITDFARYWLHRFLSPDRHRLAAAFHSPQRRAHGLDLRQPHARRGDGAVDRGDSCARVPAGLFAERDQRLHRHRGRAGRVQPHQCVGAAGTAALPGRDAQLPSLAPQPRCGRPGPLLCGALRVLGPPVRHRGEDRQEQDLARQLRRGGRLCARRLLAPAAVPVDVVGPLDGRERRGAPREPLSCCGR